MLKQPTFLETSPENFTGTALNQDNTEKWPVEKNKKNVWLRKTMNTIYTLLQLFVQIFRTMVHIILLPEHLKQSLIPVCWFSLCPCLNSITNAATIKTCLCQV